MTKRDIEYRKSLGLNPTDPLPKIIGIVQRADAANLKRPRVTALAR
ncbi:hypothetical protein SEA_PANAMAXUS_75 [Mycobacterium phage Panamaxus]|uniref:Uncharacterized protein n=1 Tax=Mycobacterium phage Veracruz TaxID=2530154 RepID=A0A481VSY0_9CAUD|nr:hypothetical protein KIP27_gp17 [Mycobacterium phage Veracruz]AIS73751.1 hypothetical protein PBI_QUINNKIRO_77 [Mycobacterium phage QuinnKiro]ALA11879.1 hypothetical protein SEA_TEXAGE_76 [Mycobacterium phage Texage]AOT24226.1 hypothetical protein SEA_TODACORO_78 [Mycobacterium phage Todacoro]AOT25579.1 hypothetical protein SEA_MARGO_78 [Mycobacterium phage Margo]AUX82373.1 hypothetical protein SEA_LAMBERT1_78 [Mycobacterium phage Lambert1]AVP42991.1 hypothetical protein SEA_PANAMAXUS_75 [